MGREVKIMDLSWINGAVCAAFVAVPFVVMAVVGLCNARREARNQPTVPSYPRRWRDARVVRAARGTQGPL